MTIQPGDKIPSATLSVMSAGDPKTLNTDELFAGKKVVLFALPGAFTPTCSVQHLPGFIQHADEIKTKGVDEIICLSVNDAFVMGAWGEAQGAAGKVTMAADGNGDFTRALGLDQDLSAHGMGVRSQRYAMIVEDGTLSLLNIDHGGDFELSDAGTILTAL